MAEQQEHNPLEVLDTLPISGWKYPRILLGIPIERTLPHAEKTFFSFADIFAQSPTYLRSSYGRTDVVRNSMALELLRTTGTHLLMLDSDHVHPQNIIQSLCKWPLLFDNVRVVCGMNFRRKPPYDPIFGNLSAGGNRPIVTEWGAGLMETEEVGAASLLVHRSVFEELPYPWFKNIYDTKELLAHRWPGEDIYFARQCWKHGIKVYVDTTTTSPHCTDAEVNEITFRQYMEDHPQEFSDVQSIGR